MLLMQGTGISKGIAKGPIYFLQSGGNIIERRHTDDFETEKQRFFRAQQVSVRQLETLSDRCRRENDEASAQ